MAVIALSKAEMQDIVKIGSLLNSLAKSTGTEEWNEIKYYDEMQASKVASTQAKRKNAYTEKSEIEKFL